MTSSEHSQDTMSKCSYSEPAFLSSSVPASRELTTGTSNPMTTQRNPWLALTALVVGFFMILLD
ncbi:hypothetical protein, partial [Nocardia brasiliensis]